MMSVYDFARATILPLDEIDQFIPKSAKVVDLGCGQGVIVKYLANKAQRNIIGVDNNSQRLPKLRTKNLKFELADIKRYNTEGANAVIISDVLHHLSLTDQNHLLANIAKKLQSGNRLIIKEIDKGEFLRSRMSRFWDFVFYPKDKIYYRSSADFKKFLESLGFKVQVSRPCRLFLGSTTLYLCQKN